MNFASYHDLTRDTLALADSNPHWQFCRGVVGVPRGGRWVELLNSDAPVYGGSGVGNFGGVEAERIECDGEPYSITLNLPPLGALFLKPA